MSDQREYVLGTDEAEFQRLGFQHRLWSDLAHQTWKHARIGPGRTVLDVGSGPGFATLDMAQIVGPGGSLLAVDESPAFLERLRAEARSRSLHTIRTLQCDAQRLDAAQIEPGSFDLAYARWVLCFVADAGAVVRGVARALKPGGRFAINDYFNYESMTIAPKHEAFSRAIRAVGRSWRDRGGDPDVVGRLPALCRAAGLRVTTLEVHQRLARPGETMWHWPDSFWKNYIPRLAASGHLSEAESREFFETWSRVSADPDAFMLLPPVFELVAEKL